MSASTDTEVQHVNVKFFVENPEAIDLEDTIHVFHSWIQQQKLDDLLIDVADYRHVPSGPGILLIGHHAQYSLDESNGRLGLLYNRKSIVDDSAQEVIVQALKAAQNVCELLQAEERFKDKLTFAKSQVQITINDRLLAPNTDETLERLKPAIDGALKSALGDKDYSLEKSSDSRARFSVIATA